MPLIIHWGLVYEKLQGLDKTTLACSRMVAPWARNAGGERMNHYMEKNKFISQMQCKGTMIINFQQDEMQ